MKRLAMVALMAAWVALPICAQRSASHGGVSSHSAPAFHSGFRASAPSRVASAPHYGAGRSPSVARGYTRAGSGNPGVGPANSDFRRHRQPYRRAYGVGVPYVVGSTGFVNPYLSGYPDTSGSDEQSAAADSGAEGSDAQAPDQGEPPPLPSWPATYAPQASPVESPVPERAEAVTLVFKDGRSPVQIHNYMLTRTTLYVLDQQHRDIPLDQLDLVSTAKVNRETGVDFRLPVSPR